VIVSAVTRLAAVLRSGRIAPALALVGATIGLAACGSGDGTIPPDDADQLLSALEDVQRDIDNGECSIAETDATQFVGLVDALPKEVGVEVKDVLRQGGESLQQMAADPEKCTEPDTGASGATGFTTTAPPPTTSTTTTETTTTETDEPPPEQPAGEGGGGNGPPGNEGNPNQGGGDSGGTEG
jgi:hypothetical protein